MPIKDPEKRKAFDRNRPNKDARNKSRREKAAQWKKAHPEQARKHRQTYMLKWRYGLTPEQYKTMYEQQGGKCANVACSRPAEYIDHNHATNVVRALLCKQCNFALGLMNDSTDIAHGLIEYLERFSHADADQG